MLFAAFILASAGLFQTADSGNITCYNDGWLAGAAPRPTVSLTNCDGCTQLLNQTSNGDVVNRGYLCRYNVRYPDNTQRYEVNYNGGPSRIVYCNCAVANVTTGCNGDANQCTPETPMPTRAPSPRVWEPYMGRNSSRR